MSQMTLHHRRKVDRQSAIFGGLFALLVNGAVLGGIWYASRAAAGPVRTGTQTFVSAQLVRFGKPRDLSFLPHVKATPKVDTPKKLKLTDDPNAKVTPKTEEPDKDDPKKLDKLAEKVKNLREDDDDRATQEAAGEGDPKGVRGGTATQAAGDPFILEIMAAITERWTVANLLKPDVLAVLEATACLTINDDGKLADFKITRPSGNDVFDGSLVATLGGIKTLPRPYGKFARNAREGTLCPIFKP